VCRIVTVKPLEKGHLEDQESDARMLVRSRPGFAFGSVHVGFVANKVALGQIYSEFSDFILCHSSVVLHTHISPGG
jgi:hypothetical protein